MGDELTHEALVILERDHPFVFVAGDWLGKLDALPDQPLDPEPNRAWKDRERDDGNLATALSPAARVGPWKECQDAPRRSLLVTKIEMVGSWVVEIDCAFDQSQSEGTSVEIEVPLRIAGDAGYVVDTGAAEAHGGDSCLFVAGLVLLVGAGARGPAFAAITAFVFGWVRWNVFGIWLPGTATVIGVPLF
jgi:hypothetical protein